MPGSDPSTLSEARGTKRRGTGDRGTAGSDIVIDTGLGPMTVAGVVHERLPQRFQAQLASWVPEVVRNEIKALEDAGAFKKAKLLETPHGRFLKRYPDGEGAVVVWIGVAHNVELHVYREFPEAFEFYLDHARGDEETAHLLHESYTQFNRDLWHFVHDLGIRPDFARSELRNIDDRVLKLILEMAGMLLAQGASVAAVRATSKQVRDTTNPKKLPRSGRGTKAGFDAGGVADELIAATQSIVNNRQKLFAAARQLSRLRHLTPVQKAQVILAYCERIGFRVKSVKGASWVDKGTHLEMYAEDGRSAFRFDNSGEILLGRIKEGERLSKPRYVWETLE
jgi:hypothetical protein